jgi:hypothetical protein
VSARVPVERPRVARLAFLTSRSGDDASAHYACVYHNMLLFRSLVAYMCYSNGFTNVRNWSASSQITWTNNH